MPLYIGKKRPKIDAVVGIDIGDFLAQTAHWSAEDTGLMLRHVCQLVSDRNWIEIREPFRVLRRGTSPRPSVTAAHRLEVLRRGECAHCGSPHMLTVDHIVPLSRGGAHALHNFQCLCWPCNRKKGSRMEAELG